MIKYFDKNGNELSGFCCDLYAISLYGEADVFTLQHSYDIKIPDTWKSQLTEPGIYFFVSEDDFCYRWKRLDDAKKIMIERIKNLQEQIYNLDYEMQNMMFLNYYIDRE